MDLDVRADETERLDEAWHDEPVLARTLEHIDGVNRWLGGTRVVLHHLRRLMPDGSPMRVLDVGTGSAAIPRTIVRKVGRPGVDLVVYAVDVQRQIARLARAGCAHVPQVAVAAADGFALPFGDGSVDVALASLTLHHLDDGAAARFVGEMARVARRAVVVNDLERHRVNVAGARLLAATLWRRSPYRHDGAISVRRGFRGPELLAIGRAAGLRRVEVHRHFPYRLALVGHTGRGP